LGLGRVHGGKHPGRQANDEDELSTRESLVAQAKEIAGNVANTNVRAPPSEASSPPNGPTAELSRRHVARGSVRV
jgi:hypothetical protein